MPAGPGTEAAARDRLDLGEAASSVSSRPCVVCYTLLSLFGIGFVLWAVLAWSGYRERYAGSADFWARGTKRSIEITLVREDIENLACASDLVLDGLRCGHRANRQPFAPPAEDRFLLRPYNTVDRVLLLGAGLWSSPGLSGPLPPYRFTVVCDYEMVGVAKSVALRWSKTGRFAPAGRSVPVGRLSNCLIPP